LRKPCPHRGGGACDSSVLPKIRVQVIQHYRNRGAIAAGRSPWSVSVFLIIGRCTFSLSIFRVQFFLFFPRKSVLNKGIKITRYPLYSISRPFCIRTLPAEQSRRVRWLLLCDEMIRFFKSSESVPSSETIYRADTKMSDRTLSPVERLSGEMK